MMFGGDDVGALIFDIGTTTSKVGFASKDAPSSIYPTTVGLIASNEKKNISHIGEESIPIASSSSKSNGRAGRNGTYYVGNQTVQYKRENMNIIKPVVDSLINDFDSMQHIYDYAFDSCLHVNPSEHPILLADPISNTRDRREKLCQIMFEYYKTPAVFMASTAVLSAFSVGKTTALILDSGGSITSCVPVFEGFALRRSVRKTRYAGEFLDRSLEHLLTNTHPITPSISPSFKINKKWNDYTQAFQVTRLDNPALTESYNRYMTLDLFRDIKENTCRVADSGAFDFNAPPFLPTTTYELPDMNTITLGADRFSVPELMFNPNHFDVSPLLPHGDIDSTYQFQGITKMIQDTINASDVDLRRELYSNIIPVGGNSLMPGLIERTQRQLATSVTSSIKVRLQTANSNMERQYSAWIGGSILASLGSFQQMWFSKAEYEEYGAALIEKKCP